MWVADLRAPGGGLGHQPVGDGCRVAALDLPEQPASADGVDEADVPGVRDKLPLFGVRVLFPHRFAPPGLVDPDRLGSLRLPGQDVCGVVLEAVLHDRPGQVQVAAGLHHGARAVTDRGPAPPPRRRALVVRIRAGT